LDFFAERVVCKARATRAIGKFKRGVTADEGLPRGHSGQRGFCEIQEDTALRQTNTISPKCGVKERALRASVRRLDLFAAIRCGRAGAHLT